MHSVSPSNHFQRHARGEPSESVGSTRSHRRREFLGPVANSVPDSCQYLVHRFFRKGGAVAKADSLSAQSQRQLAILQTRNKYHWIAICLECKLVVIKLRVHISSQDHSVFDDINVLHPWRLRNVEGVIEAIFMCTPTKCTRKLKRECRIRNSSDQENKERTSPANPNG